MCYRLVGEIVAFGNSGIEGGNALISPIDCSLTTGRR